MVIFDLVTKNLFRNPLRTTLTAVAVALPSMVFVTAIAITDGIDNAVNSLTKETRLAVQHYVSLGESLPDSHRLEIESLDPTGADIVAVCRMRWFGGKVGDHPTQVWGLACDHDALPMTHPDLKLQPSELELWNLEKRALIAGYQLSRYFGWQVGQTIRLRSNVPPFQELEFVIVKVLDTGFYDYAAFFRKDYLDDRYRELNVERLGGEVGGANVIMVRCRDPQRMDVVAQRIDAHFARASAQTSTQEEDQLQRSFLFMGANVSGVMLLVAGVVVLVTSLAAGNCMSMAFRERIREMAVLKAIGFSNHRVMTLVLAEGALLSVLAGAAGALVPLGVFNTGLLTAVVRGISGDISMTDQPGQPAGSNRGETASAQNSGIPQRPADSVHASALPKVQADGGQSASPEAQALTTAGSGTNPTPADKRIHPGLFELTRMRISTESVIKALFIALAIGVISGLGPAISAARLKTVEALKHVA